VPQFLLELDVGVVGSQVDVAAEGSAYQPRLLQHRGLEVRPGGHPGAGAGLPVLQVQGPVLPGAAEAGCEEAPGHRQVQAPVGHVRFTNEEYAYKEILIILVQ